MKKLHPDAKLPTVANPGEDIGYDLYALEDTKIYSHCSTKVPTGIAVAAFTQMIETVWSGQTVRASYTVGEPVPLGLLIRDRSSMASMGILTHGGVIDAGYRGEIGVLMSVLGLDKDSFMLIRAGQKIAQMVPVPVLTGPVEELELPAANRGEKGFGSSGA